MTQKSNNPDASEKVNPSHEDGFSSGAHGTKDNSECASLRLGNLPQAEKVQDVVPLPEGTAAKHAATQNSSLASNGRRILNQPPNSSKRPSTTSGN
jgi:hypothetical protein